MVGFVIVSHSENLAKSVVELTSIMAPKREDRPGGRHGRWRIRHQL